MDIKMKSNSTYPMIENFRTRFCNGSSSATGTQVRYIDYFDFLTSDDDIMFVGGRGHRIQRVEWTSNSTCTAQISAGKSSTKKNLNADDSEIDPGTLAAADINITADVSFLNVSGTGANRRILFGHEGHVDELTESAFVSGSEDTAWQQQYGGALLSRLEGAKRAIVAVLSDTTLTTGANFGFGHWNSGEGSTGQYDVPHPLKLKKKARRGKGGSYCHDNNTRCNYYGGWKGVHPSGTSKICTFNSCLNVGIGPEGAAKAIPIVQRLGIEFGTDSEAFSQIAHDYFMGPVSPYDPASDCQLNYVIVIGDGKMTSSGTKSNKFKGRTADRLTKLRKKELKV